MGSWTLIENQSRETEDGQRSENCSSISAGRRKSFNANGTREMLETKPSNLKMPPLLSAYSPGYNCIISLKLETIETKKDYVCKEDAKLSGGTLGRIRN